MTETREEPPNFHEVLMPACCMVCVSFVSPGSRHDDLSSECEKFAGVMPHWSWVCDEFKRED